MHEMDFLDNFEDLNKNFVHRADCLEIIRCFARDLAIMTNEMLCPKDLGLGNIMFNTAEVKMAWIDTDLKKKYESKKAVQTNYGAIDASIFKVFERASDRSVLGCIL